MAGRVDPRPTVTDRSTILQSAGDQNNSPTDQELNALTVSSVPTEIWNLIFELAAGSNQPEDRKTLGAIRTTCKDWKRILDNGVIEEYWKKISAIPYFKDSSMIKRINQAWQTFETRRIVAEWKEKTGSNEIADQNVGHWYARITRKLPPEMEVAQMRREIEQMCQELDNTSDPTPTFQRFIQLSKSIASPLQLVLPCDYEETLQQQLDLSLVKIWGKIKSNRIFANVPPLTDATEIHNWLLDPANNQLINRVTDLDLSGLQLTMLPPEIDQFSSLQTLNLQKNRIRTLPSQIGNLTSLRELNLDFNQLETFPSEACNLVSLQKLSLNGNEISELPIQIGNLVGLQELSLCRNKIIELPTQIGNLCSLQNLFLRNNKITNLPPEIRQLSLLERLSLENNVFTEFPTEIASLPALKWLILNDNQIDEIPAQIGNFPVLQWLYLNNNVISKIPSEISKLTLLQELGLESNLLDEFPVEVCTLSRLKRLYLDGNKISVLPSAIDQLSLLEQLHLPNNQIRELPPEIGQLPQLQLFSLYNNQIDKLPPEICNLPRLKELQLQNNQIVELPVQISGLTSLERLYLNDNQIYTLPSEMKNMPKLKELSLLGNPLLFILDKDLSSIDSTSIVSIDNVVRDHHRYHACAEYRCRSPLAALCQSVHCNEDIASIRGKFFQLAPEMKDLIKKESGNVPEEQLFADRKLFNTALCAALKIKFSELTAYQKWDAYSRIGSERRARDNIIRLIDSIEPDTSSWLYQSARSIVFYGFSALQSFGKACMQMLQWAFRKPFEIVRSLMRESSLN